MRWEQWLRKIVSLTGKTVLVTGANSGIGYAAASHFLTLGADLILACRSEERGNAAATRLREQFPHRKIELLQLDLSAKSSIDNFAKKIEKRGAKIDILLSCAGVYYPRETKTADGLPMTVGVNYVGTVWLVEALLPMLKENGRVVLTTSLVDRFGKVQKHPRSKAKEGYADYAESKLLLSAYVLKKAAERRPNEPLFLAAHPGITATSLLDPAKTSHNPIFSKLGHAFLYVFTHSKEKAALTAVFAAAGKVKNGDCIGPRGPFGISGFPHITKFCRHARRQAREGTDPYRAI